MLYRKVFQIKENRVLTENIFSLGLFNIINYVFPLLIIPHLTRTLGSENYGLYAFATVVIGYFSLLVRYGFDLSVTKEIALARADHEAVRKIFWRAVAARLTLCLVCGVILGGLILVIPAMREHALLYASGLLLLLETALMPTWLFQGMETMKIIAALNFLMKGGAFLLIVTLVRDKEDCTWAFFLYNGSFLFGGVVGFLIALRRFALLPVQINVCDIFLTLRDGWHVFVACIGTNLYREVNVFILGLTSSYQEVGYFFVANKLISAVQSFCTLSIMQGLYPYMSRKLKEAGGNVLFRKIGLYYGLLMLLVMIVFGSLANWLIPLYLGENFRAVVPVIWILSPLILIGSLNYYGGIVGLINLGYQKSFALFVWIAGGTSIICCIPCSYFLAAAGAALATLMAEAVLLFCIIRKCRMISYSGL